MANEKLEPPDPNQCQAERPQGSFMTLGGRPTMVRCTNTPVWLATEKKAPKRGAKRGSMTLCAECRAVLDRQMPGYATLKPLVVKVAEAVA